MLSSFFHGWPQRAIATMLLALERRQVLARGVAGDAMTTTLNVATLQRAVTPWPILGA